MNNGTWELYDKTKEYFDEQGDYLTYDKFKEKYPSVESQRFTVRTLGNTIVDALAYDYIRAKENVPLDYSDEEAIRYINASYYSRETESTPLERIASALEYIAMSIRNKGVNTDEL